MNYDRKNITPEFEIHNSFHKNAFSLEYRSNSDHVKYKIPLKLALKILEKG